MTITGNFTLPAGASDHGDPGLLCVPTKWTDVVGFFLGNYLAHAATVRTIPGASILDTATAAFGALVFPLYGFDQGLDGILSLAKFGKTDLQIAARAGALCKVVKIADKHESFLKNDRIFPLWDGMQRFNAPVLLSKS